ESETDSNAKHLRLSLRLYGYNYVRRRRVALLLPVAGFQPLLVARRLFGFETGEERRFDVQTVLVRRQSLELHVGWEARPDHGPEREQAHADVRRQQPALKDHGRLGPVSRAAVRWEQPDHDGARRDIARMDVPVHVEPPHVG